MKTEKFMKKMSKLIKKYDLDGCCEVSFTPPEYFFYCPIVKYRWDGEKFVLFQGGYPVKEEDLILPRNN